MSGPWSERLGRALGLRVAVWYAGFFVITSIAVGGLTYALLVMSLEQRDHDLLLVKLAEYTQTYQTRGVRDVSDAVAAEQASGATDSVMVRLVGRGADVLLLSLPAAWTEFDLTRLDIVRASGGGDDWQLVPSAIRDQPSAARLEVVSRRLWDGTVMQVGRTTLERERFLSQVRGLLGIVMIVVLAAGLAGGVALTKSALRPLRELGNTVRGIARTGRLDVRVAPDTQGDIVGELGEVFNAMIARIDMLVAGMRDALDNVAHDLRTPIARLRARAESVLSAPATEAECREALAECVEEADRVIALLTTLMDISEAASGTMRLSLEAVPVEEVIADTIDLYEDAAEEQGVALSSSGAGELRVQADRQRLRQVLANLVDNAVKYTPSGGRVELGAAADGGGVVITVRDTGMGIAPGDMPRIWERLYRGDPGTGRGLGLGLSLVRAIVAAHGGAVDVESTVGKGSTFRVSLSAGANAAEKTSGVPST